MADADMTFVVLLTKAQFELKLYIAALARDLQDVEDILQETNADIWRKAGSCTCCGNVAGTSGRGRRPRRPAPRRGTSGSRTWCVGPGGRAGRAPLPTSESSCSRANVGARADARAGGRPAPRAARVRPRQARPSRVAPRDFTSEQFRREGRNLLRPLSQAPGTVAAK